MCRYDDKKKRIGNYFFKFDGFPQFGTKYGRDAGRYLPRALYV